MLKLSDPFKMSDVFVGLFYNAETEGLPNEGAQKSNERINRLYLRARAAWRKILSALAAKCKTVPPVRREVLHEALKPESLHLDAAPSENGSSGFRPLTQEEKRLFLNSLDDRGKSILEELQGRKKKRRLRPSVARVRNPNPIGIVPGIETSNKEMVNVSFSNELSSSAQPYRVHWMN